jgi:hypothetical protein
MIRVEPGQVWSWTSRAEGGRARFRVLSTHGAMAQVVFVLSERLSLVASKTLALGRRGARLELNADGTPAEAQARNEGRWYGGRPERGLPASAVNVPRTPRGLTAEEKARWLKK